jgi:adenosylmethionine-8-amino-7-oxononanoate aminotransferase
MNDWNAEDHVAADKRCSIASTRIMPDIMKRAKALTGIYVPIAITLLTEQNFSAFSERSSKDETAVSGGKESA